HRRGRGLPRGCVPGGGAHRQVAGTGCVDRALRGGQTRQRARVPSVEGRAPARRPRPRRAARPPRDSRPTRDGDGAALAGEAMNHTLDLVTRVRGVRGAMLVSADDGLVVAEQLMEGIKGSAVAALAASLAGRLRRAMEAAGLGASVFWHLQSDQGTLLVVPAASGVLVV